MLYRKTVYYEHTKKTVENLVNGSVEVLRNAYTGKQEQLDKITWKLEAKSPEG